MSRLTRDEILEIYKLKISMSSLIQDLKLNENIIEDGLSKEIQNQLDVMNEMFGGKNA